MTSSEASGESAAGVKLTAVGSGRDVDLSALSVPALLICFAQETQAGIDPIEQAAHERYPDASRLLVAHVVDLHKIPGMLRKVAEGVLGNEHKKAVEELPAGVPAADYVMILPDWDGSAIRALGLEDPARAVGVVLIRPGGAIAWRYQGAEAAAAVRARFEAVPL